MPRYLLKKAILLSLLSLLTRLAYAEHETVWIEAEHFAGVKGYCWPMGPKPVTNGHWGISGPGWASEWTQGGESNFMSIACGAEDDKAVAHATVEIPVNGTYHVWIRFRDNRGCSSRFQLRLTPDKGEPALLTYGTKPVIEEDNELKLYWNWAFGWEGHKTALSKGPAKLELLSAFQEKGCRQIDCIVLTTDAAYRPLIKERPSHATWDMLEKVRAARTTKLEPLARRTGQFSLPPEWQPRTFRDKGFLYLWNMDQVKWAGEDPQRVPVPYHLRDADALAAFEKKYAASKDVPIFSDPRIVPTFHGAGPKILATDAKDAKQSKNAGDFTRWLDANPERPWAMMMNYAAPEQLPPGARENFLKYRERYVGNISGENLGYFDMDQNALAAETQNAKTRRDLAAALTKVALAANSAKYQKIFGQDWPDAYREVIPCKSVGMPAFAPLCYQWGARTVGYESSAMTIGLLSMRMAFLRGAARQFGGMTATYRSCNFGDASTIFSDAQSYTRPRHILDNYYGVFSGAGMTWYKMDIWYQYMCGASMFYHEQGFDEFWIPGGTAAAGLKELQLSPKGNLVDRFLRVTQDKSKDRGAPFTPVAFLLDYAHGWEPSPFEPHAFGNMARRPDLTLYGAHEQMLREYFFTAYHPIGPKTMEPITATNEVYVPGVYGDIFDVIYATPDVQRWKTIDTYPVVIAAGEIELTLEEGKRLAQYVENGGTLVVADEQLSGPGVAALKLPELGQTAEADFFAWQLPGTPVVSPRFRFKPVKDGRALAVALPGVKPVPNFEPPKDTTNSFCSAFDRGKGRLIFLSVPKGLGIDRVAVPALPLLLSHVTRELMPVEVFGDVEWMVNRNATGWVVTLLNPAGQAKPQHGITPTDFRENRRITIKTVARSSSAADWLFPEEKLELKADGEGSSLELTVPAGGVRIVEFK
ncbi:MAG TPA: hypothetical protein VEK08_23735 [Planctomycetota bacterium]|nr:hypothetical protein [Planctomycetota bacterium]